MSINKIGVSSTFTQLGYNLKRTEEWVMKAYRKELWFEVPTRRALINITPQVNTCLKESGIKEGLVLVKAKHTLFITLSHLFY